MGQSLRTVDLELAIGIVGHTTRGDQAAQLAEQVGAVYRSVDNGTLGCDNNHRKVWRWMAGRTHTPRWTLVLEDDAIPVPDFHTHAAAALTAAPTPIVSLYLGTSRPVAWQTRIQRATTQADKADACYITSTHLLHAVAVAIRTDLIADMLNHLPPGKPIDNAISQWARNQHHGIAYTWPSLVDHADGPTLVKHTYNTHSQPRKAWRTATRSAQHSTTVTM